MLVNWASDLLIELRCGTNNPNAAGCSDWTDWILLICEYQWIMFVLMMARSCRHLLQQLLMMMLTVAHYVSSYQQCSSSCACLGNTVDCSNKQLPDIPTDLPTWTEILWVSRSLFNHSRANCRSDYTMFEYCLIGLGEYVGQSESARRGCKLVKMRICHKYTYSLYSCYGGTCRESQKQHNSGSMVLLTVRTHGPYYTNSAYLPCAPADRPFSHTIG